MKITQLQQSGLIIETSKGYKLAIDIAVFTPIEELEGLSADAMIVSHLHGDHFSAEHIKKLSPKKLFLNKECIDLFGENAKSLTPNLVKVGDEIEFDGIKVTFFDVDHGPNTKVGPKENFGLLIEADGEKIYFAGDMYYQSGIDVAALEVDHAFIPVGTFYTFGPKEALDFAKKFKKIGRVVPMHYQLEPKAKDEFISLAKAEGININ